MLEHQINKKTYKNYINKLSLITRFTDIPVEYRQNYSDPFKPFFNCPYELHSPYEYAISILSRYTIDDIKRMRAVLSKEVILTVRKVVDFAKNNRHESHTFRFFAKHNDMLTFYLNNNVNFSDLDFDILDLYAVMCIKFIKRALVIKRKASGFPEIDFAFENLIKTNIKSDKVRTDKKIRHKKASSNSYIENLTLAMDSIILGILFSNNSAKIKLTENRMKGLYKFQSQIEEKKQYALKIATQLWTNDKEKILRTGYVAELVRKDLNYKYGNQAPVINTIKDWIKPIRPDYADNKGRENKSNKKMLLELYKLHIK